MKRKKALFLTSLLLLWLNLNIITFEKSVANPAPLVKYAGGILTKDNYSLSLISADVKIDLDALNLSCLGGLSFKANYTIFNPDEEVNLTIAAPFEFYPLNNCTVSVNNTPIPFLILDYDEMASGIWYEFLQYVNRYSAYWIICSISILKNSSIEIKYEFNCPKPLFYSFPAYFNIIYDVGTARLWHGNITEIVEFRVHGHLPNSIYNERLCNVSEISDGQCYTWEWINELIEIDYVGIHYDLDNPYDNNMPFSFLEISIFILISLFVILGIAFIIISIENRRKYWWKKYVD
ncbi:MAG: hypothetical protein ACFE9N_09870 [Promethearchaeota archaeon]